MSAIFISFKKGATSTVGKPKKRTSSRRTGMRRSHLVLELARAVNSKSPVKARTTAKQSGKKLAAGSAE
ncbi:50S ribosomal protein L32 [Candidatus Saccharibacteria bacterium]|nr:MAG: 50S ribosomal protein L32 [Candidatus Saccharibacteria bacterium]